MSKKPNILFLLSDEHSFRFVSARSVDRGGEPCYTPSLDGLIAQGVHFDNAYCQMPLCTPSRIAMLTGRNSHSCAALTNGSVLNPEIPTFAFHFGKNEYATVAVGKMHLGGSCQYGGFAERPYGDFGGYPAHQIDPLIKAQDMPGPFMDMRSRTTLTGITEIPESLLQEQIVIRESVAWLREHYNSDPDSPWLLLASFSRPHYPLTAPKRFFERYYPKGVTAPRIRRTGDSADHPMTLGAIKGFRTDEINEAETMKARAGYFACVDMLDETIGDFLTILARDGLLENTIVIYTADHGELAGEHGLWWKNTWHEGATRVPLVVSLPEHRSGDIPPLEVQVPVSLADIFPTLCGLADIDKPEGLDGIDLTEALEGRPCSALSNRPGVIVESLAPRWGEGTEFRMIRSPRYKYIAFRGCPDLAFNMLDDPDEQNNLVSPKKRQSPQIKEELEKLKVVLFNGFDFEQEGEEIKREAFALKNQYRLRNNPQTPNQILLGTGILVEADAPLYKPLIVSENPAEDYDDYPG